MKLYDHKLFFKCASNVNLRRYSVADAPVEPPADIPPVIQLLTPALGDGDTDIGSVLMAGGLLNMNTRPTLILFLLRSNVLLVVSAFTLKVIYALISVRVLVINDTPARPP